MAIIDALEDLFSDSNNSLVEHRTDLTLKRTTGIDDLPSELLLEIFKILKDEGSNAQPFQAPWVPVTWVCRRWRVIAQNHPSLWSTLSLQQRPREEASVTAFLKNSANVALTLYMQPNTFSLLTAQPARRVRDIAISYTPQQRHYVPGFIKRAGLSWTSLELHQQSVFTSHRMYLDAAHVPNLRRLQIRGIPLRPVGVFQGLAHLTIERPGEYSVDALYDVLQACPNLVDLVLKYALPYYELRMETPPNVLTLQKLERLVLHTPGQDVACFLTWVRFSRSATFSITLEYQGYPPIGDDYDGWLQALLCPPQKSPSLPITTHTRSLALFLGCADIIEADLRLFGSTAPERITLPPKSSCWSLTVNNLDSLDDNRVFMTPMLPQCCLPTIADLLELVLPPNITTLDLHIAPGLSVKQDWPAWLARLPHLHELTIGGVPLISAILSALHPRPGLLPELKTLRLCFAVLPEDKNPPKIDPEAFMAWITLRLLAGMSLHTFTMQIPPGFRGQALLPELPATVALVRELESRAVGVDQPVQVCYRLCETCHFAFDDVASLH
ncbi:hypothetical protein C8Q70DRAFT_991053 [Cubamyces menziesii]|uniref:F-box domain-containing protein n=1 Tax=Trametes cubensis TaxID=1111947 RepID=A0AAD7X9X2_9APHY|nr:hypothetical protein C8Q70DRAFT_991053 [Cubamyces menziesii]KAJ8475360.1 hypothetical protein ONZ51_g6594 [Trametes cubensis]